MNKQSIGCHIFVFKQFGYDFDTQLDEIFDLVAQTGYGEIELIKFMVEAEDSVKRVRDALARNNLGLVGSSIGQPFWDLEKYDSIMKSMEEYSDWLSRFDKTQCGVSCIGKKMIDRRDEENDQAIKVWKELASLFKSKGVTLNYHPHGEPGEDIEFVIDNVPAEILPLGPDIDWLRVGGVDPWEFLKNHGSRLSMMHLRDYHLGGDRTEALGEGDCDFSRLREVIDETGFSGNIVVELALPPGKTADRSLEKLLTLSRDVVKNQLF